MKRRKHRVVVKITTSYALTERDATRAMQVLLDRIDKDQKPIYPTGGAGVHVGSGLYADKLTAKQFSFVNRFVFK
jgi:hypothetical protein